MPEENETGSISFLIKNRVTVRFFRVLSSNTTYQNHIVIRTGDSKTSGKAGIVLCVPGSVKYKKLVIHYFFGVHGKSYIKFEVVLASHQSHELAYKCKQKAEFLDLT